MDPFETGRFAEIPQEQVAAVRTAGDLAAVIVAMRDDLVGTGRQEWENATLERFLEALAALVEGQDHLDRPSWQDVARMLVTATGYE